MQLLDEAIERIQTLIEQAQNSQLREPMAASFATVDLKGRPSVRTLLLKQADRDGLVFYTNTRSNKGQHLQENPYAAICIYYQEPHQQVQVAGPVEPVTAEEADAYWRTRPRASQLGAWASRQSEVLSSRQELEERVETFDARYAGVEVPRPDHWSGYRVVPERIEFWAGHPSRLNHRERYMLRQGEWVKELLNP
jgi:pyridoxamine 5'-phosphate oxidase